MSSRIYISVVRRTIGQVYQHGMRIYLQYTNYFVGDVDYSRRNQTQSIVDEHHDLILNNFKTIDWFFLVFKICFPEAQCSKKSNKISCCNIKRSTRLGHNILITASLIPSIAFRIILFTILDRPSHGSTSPNAQDLNNTSSVILVTDYLRFVMVLHCIINQ